MAKIYFSLFDLNNERRKEIISRAIIVNNFYCKKYIKNYYGKYDSYYKDINLKLDKSISIYKFLFKEELNNSDRSLLFLYIIFPDDNKFINSVKNNKFDFDKVGKQHGVSKKCAIFRYKCYREIKKYDENIKKLKKENC